MSKIGYFALGAVCGAIFMNVWNEMDNIHGEGLKDRARTLEDLNKDLDATTEATAEVIQNIRAGKYNSVGEAMQDYEFQKIVKRDSKN